MCGESVDDIANHLLSKHNITMNINVFIDMHVPKSIKRKRTVAEQCSVTQPSSVCLSSNPRESGLVEVQTMISQQPERHLSSAMDNRASSPESPGSCIAPDQLGVTELVSKRIETEYDALTYEDQDCLNNGQPLPKYDAFILYSEEDSDTVADIVKNLENQVRHLGFI